MITEQGRILELLLSGAFICQVSDEDAWRYLKTSGNSDKIEIQLNILNRTLASAADGDVFFAAYQSLNEPERKQLGSQFQDISSNLMPLVEWLLLVQQANGSDVPVTQGAAIRLNQLQSTIEDTPAFAEQLEKISRFRMFGSTSTQLDGQLKQVFKRLTELGYLLKPNSEKQIYIATGKVEYLYDVLKFIDETEVLSLTEQAENAVQQGTLL
jgi:hypothetical protein